MLELRNRHDTALQRSDLVVAHCRLGIAFRPAFHGHANLNTKNLDRRQAREPVRKGRMMTARGDAATLRKKLLPLVIYPDTLIRCYAS